MSSRYINPYTDFGFKKLFGEEANKDLLIDFLNSLLPQKHQIAELTFQNPEDLPDSPIQRKSVFDVVCKSSDDETFIVEMQKAEQHYFKDRSLFYTTSPIRKQAPKGVWDYRLKTVYFIGILDFEYDEDEERRKFIREAMLKDQDGDIFYDKLRFIFLQMPLFKKTEAELENHKDKWFYFLKNLETFDNIPAILQEPIFEQAFETAEYANLSQQEQEKYIKDWFIYNDNYAVVKTACDKAEIKGKAEGIAEGETQKSFEIANKMKQRGFDPATIAEMTGLSLEEIRNLK